MRESAGESAEVARRMKTGLFVAVVFDIAFSLVKAAQGIGTGVRSRSDR